MIRQPRRFGRPGRRSDTDRELTSRAWRRIAAQGAAAFTVALLGVGGVEWLVLAREQGRDVGRQLAMALASADDVVDPPPHVYLFLRGPDGRVARSPGSPAGLPDQAALTATAATGRPRTATTHVGGGEFVVRTERHDGLVLQAAYDLHGYDDERHRVLAALLLAEAIGLAAAAGVGAVLGRRAVAPLGQALARQRQFVADAAHELRTPLTLLHTRVQLLEQTARRRGDVALAAEAHGIVEDTSRLGDVVGDLLLSADLARHPDRHDTVDLDRLARDAVAAAAAHAQELRIRLTLDRVPPAAAGAPAAGPPVEPATDPTASPGPPLIVTGVESALRRAIADLIDNALGHTPAGGAVTVILTTRTDRGDGWVAVQVADTGVGLDRTDTRRLFERFARGEAVGDRRRFGLGLALVHETVTNHHGRIEVDGAPGAGASFTLLLPAAPGPGARSTRPPGAGGPGGRVTL